jgi:purine-binding chemotaxis protein CheW
MANDEHLPDDLDARGPNDSPLEAEGSGDSFELPNWSGFGEPADLPEVAMLAPQGASEEAASGDLAPAWGDVQPEWLAATADVERIDTPPEQVEDMPPVAPWAAPPDWGWQAEQSVPEGSDGDTSTLPVPVHEVVAPEEGDGVDLAAPDEPLEVLAVDADVAVEVPVEIEAEEIAAVEVEDVEPHATAAETVDEATPRDEPVEEVVVEVAEQSSDDAREALAEILDEIEREVVVDGSTDLSTDTVRSSHLADQYVVFVLGGTNYAVPMGNVLEMNLVPKTTPVPNVPDWVRGVTNLRGNILPIIELRSFFGFSPLEQTGAGRMVVVRSLEDDMTTGLVVDSVRGRRDLVSNTIEAPAAPIEDKVAPFMRGVHGTDDEMLVVFDMERFLASPEVRQFESD